jgi:DNA polymerase (family 10)
MAESAQSKGYEYFAITDHSRHLTVAKGLTPERLKKQIRAIDRINAKLKGIRILKAIEVDILEDGKLDLPDEILKELDLRVCSIHYRLDLPEKAQTERVIRAMDNRYFNVLGHPTGRLIGERPAYAIDLERVFAAARERGCFVELNAQPERLDLSDALCRMAKDAGVLIAISTDAHDVSDMELMRFGVLQARRGWLEKKDILNTRSLAELEKLLRRR